jgi:serine/threonine-protein kinase
MLQGYEELEKLREQLPVMLRGERRAANARQAQGLMELCREKQLHLAAARFADEAFAADPKLADDLSQGHRYKAACSAALAAAGKGEDAAKLDAKEQARLRKQALDWLRADLTAQQKQLKITWPGAATAARAALLHWQEDSDLAGIRDQAALEKLPPAEREAFTKLWADVAALLQIPSASSRENSK